MAFPLLHQDAYCCAKLHALRPVEMEAETLATEGVGVNLSSDTQTPISKWMNTNDATIG